MSVVTNSQGFRVWMRLGHLVQRGMRCGAIEAGRIAAAYRLPPEDLLVCKPFDAALDFKIIIRRPVSSGDLMDTDVYGCQQHVLLTGIVVPAG
ncbi:DUF4387 family protein [Muricoccus radiodurans]|uniref:DUF4387 family protein n=1 Tax=Muricoccus radiodurans TaxID=2231721 RepID=UPI003CF6A6B3